MTTTATTTVATRPAGGRRGGRGPIGRIGRVVAYAMIIAAAAAILVPFVWMVGASLKRDNEVFTVPTQWIPHTFRWRNFTDIWTKIPLSTYLRNTVFLSTAITLLQVLTGSFAAYGFAKVRFRGRDALFFGYVATIALPWQAYMIPQYIMMQKAGLTDTFWSLILLQGFGAFGVFLMRQYYMTIPDELCEAARVDGLTEYGIWARIILPLSKPALASLALLTFVNTWNDFMGPFIYLTSNDHWTIQLGLQSFVGEFDSDYALMMTGSVLSVLPILAVFLVGQRHFIQGIATSGMKG
jgi:multiple sugar transport system permease protein